MFRSCRFRQRPCRSSDLGVPSARALGSVPGAGCGAGAHEDLRLAVEDVLRVVRPSLLLEVAAVALVHELLEMRRVGQCEMRSVWEKERTSGDSGTETDTF